MENKSYLPTYTEAVQLDPNKLGLCLYSIDCSSNRLLILSIKESHGDPVKFIPDTGGYGETSTTVIHVIQPTQFGSDRDLSQSILFQNSQEIFCIKCRQVHRTKILRANHSSFRYFFIS